MDNKDILRFGLEKFNINADEEILFKFIKYKDLLVKWNERMNLTGIEDEKDIFIKHFLDSISIVKSGLIKEDVSVIDVGTGAGLPGIPIKICFDNIKLTLLDSLNKRINFLRVVGDELDFKNVDYVHSRAEDLGKIKDFREKYDIAVARAVAGLPVLLELCSPFVKKGGYFICFKGPSVELELSESQNAIDLLGLNFLRKVHIVLPDTDLKHNILIFKKISNISSKYPRRAGTPSKNPLV